MMIHLKIKKFKKTRKGIAGLSNGQGCHFILGS